MNPHQRDAVANRIQRDQVYAQAFHNEITQKRNLRKHAIDTANQILNQATEPKGRADAKTLISYATEIYNFMTQDGELADLGVEPKVQLA